ncbi:hypothetical protein SMACR_04091 [Sordaria macrospora]|uniref:WGS project CABT00000000 data, contig 2.15 n=2 Tax=Sordaria macrospora TaxID=5147 RepID=F7VZB2_SORMK|nr:uncharacterized protein SMAC_04091 [Sordaria macrospora k-hell]KAA8629893.1 hypothetical protein SMACR_04091 [Sordaria macrospora]KAH7635903.1 hypothetical protein B0T09DRAFT_29809 [Sordaria sp. MPI-SDFR-AT-0083]WPJ64371.1 hypothetical protein SMAC4_04091 [Sordaria macrospora]CCC10860.1 unnamed protein product [Sordaria macrospora k-hell]
MKVSSRFDGSICGTIFLHRPSWNWSAIAASATAIAATTPSQLGDQGSGRRRQVATAGLGPATQRRRFHGGWTSQSGLVDGAARRPIRGSTGCPLLTTSSLRVTPTSLSGTSSRRALDSNFFRYSVSAPQKKSHTAAAAAPVPEPEPEPELVAAAATEPSADQKPAADSVFSAPSALHDDPPTEPPWGANPQSQEPPESHNVNPGHLTKEELLELVDPYRGLDGTVEDHLKFIRDPHMHNYAPADRPRFTFVQNEDDYEYPGPDEVIGLWEEEGQRTLSDLRFAVLVRLRTPHKVDLDTIYDLYQQLPEPRMPFINGRLRHQLLKALGQPQRRNSKSMLRYFAVIADVRNCSMPLTAGEWNCAISFASRYVGTVTETQAQSAMRLWREMEVDAGIKATEVTFNILFDVASKAGNFTLAEMIYQEMVSRGHYFNRYHHVSLIHFFGLKRETGGLRAAFREMVEAGEMIDTVVLNAVISGLLRSGEEAAVERIYACMVASMAKWSKVPFPARSYASDRAITQSLKMMARVAKKAPELQQSFQEMAPMHPNLRTYSILVKYYGVGCGDLSRVAKYIDEMKLFDIPVHGSIFKVLFKAFDRHGGYPTSAWSAKRLESIYSALIEAIDAGRTLIHQSAPPPVDEHPPADEEAFHDDHLQEDHNHEPAHVQEEGTQEEHHPEIYDDDEAELPYEYEEEDYPQRKEWGVDRPGIEIKTWLAIWVLRAFMRCTDADRVVEVYEQLRARWELNDKDELFMADFLSSLLINGSKRQKW